MPEVQFCKMRSRFATWRVRGGRHTPAQDPGARREVALHTSRPGERRRERFVAGRQDLPFELRHAQLLPVCRRAYHSRPRAG